MLPPTDLSRPALKAAGTGDHSRKQRRRALCVAAQSHLNHRCVGCGRSVSLRGRDTAARIGASGTATVGAELDHWVGGGREAEIVLFGLFLIESPSTSRLRIVPSKTNPDGVIAGRIVLIEKMTLRPNLVRLTEGQ